MPSVAKLMKIRVYSAFAKSAIRVCECFLTHVNDWVFSMNWFSFFLREHEKLFGHHFFLKKLKLVSPPSKKRGKMSLPFVPDVPDVSTTKTKSWNFI